MKVRLKNCWEIQAGFTLLEVIISLALVSVMGVGAATIVGQTFTQNKSSTSTMKTLEQAESVAYWLNHDTLMAQAVSLSGGSGFPLVLSWQDTNSHLNQATYGISGGSFQRTLYLDSVLAKQSTVASNVNTDAAKTNCSYSTGVLNFQITSAVGNDSQTRYYQVKLRIDQPTNYLTITTSTLSPGYTDTAYTQALTAAGGISPYTWVLNSGSLPSGLSLSNSGIVSGTPNVGLVVSVYTFTVLVTDSSSLKAAKNFTLVMNPLTITRSSLPNGKKSKGYGTNTPNSPVYLTATGGTTIYTWALTSGNLPPGLSLNTSSGLISGTPNDTTGGQTYSFTITLTDSLGQTATNNYSIYVAP